MADVNTILLRMREMAPLVRAAAATLPVSVLMAVELFDQLDNALSGGGTLPLDWQGARQPITAGVQPGWLTGLLDGPDAEPMTEI